MFSDPLVLNMGVTTVPVYSSPQYFVRSGNDSSSAQYRFLDGDMNDYVFKVGHSYGRTRNRFTIRCDLNGISPSAMTPSENTLFSQSCYAVFDCPATGPIVNTTTVLTLDRRIMNAVGQMLLAGANSDPIFLARVVKAGEL
jgi:hypothetical protein